MNQKLLDKYLFLFGIGGLLYILIELIGEDTVIGPCSLWVESVSYFSV